MPRTGLPNRRRHGKRNKDYDLRIHSWNVRTLYEGGALQKLLQEMDKYQTDITAIQEARWLGNGIIDKKQHIIYYSCHNKKHEFGTAFVVKKRINHLVIAFEPISENMCKIRLRGKFFNISIINCHAPTEVKPDDEKDQFYEKLMRCLEKCPKHDIKLVIGDMNAKVGREPFYFPTIGKHSIHEECNNNGERLVNFAITNNMKIASTWFPHKKNHLVTWRSPDGSTCNTIDHFLIDSRHFSNVMDVRTFRGANIDSDHFLVGMRLRARISDERKSKLESTHKKFNLEALNNPNKAEEYTTEVHNRLTSAMREENNLESKWENCKTSIKLAAEETLGYEDKGKRNSWFDEECQKVTDEKNIAYRKMLQRHVTRGAKEMYKEKRRQEKKVHKQKKKEHLKKQLEALEEHRAANNSRAFYRQSNVLRKEFKPRTVMCKDLEDNIISSKEKVLDRWAQHFERLLNPISNIPNPARDPDANRPPTRQTHTETVKPTLEDITNAVKRLKNNKAAGSDGIPSELLKYGGDMINNTLHEIIGEIWETTNIPNEWQKGIICPIHKKGDTLNCTNYRGITLLNTAYKVLSNILYHRLIPHVEKILGQYQCGFRPGKSTTDQIFSLRQIIEKTKEYNIDTHILFIDFKSAYDTIRREELYKAMVFFKLPEHLIKLVKMTMSHIECQVKLGGHTSRTFQAKVGLRQGDALSCMLFNLALEKTLRDAGALRRGCILNGPIQILAYADDIAIISRTTYALKKTFAEIDSSAKRIGLVINEGKTKYLKIRATYDHAVEEEPSLKIENYTFEKVEEFVYLGSLMRQDGDTTAEIKRRIALASRTYYGLRSQLRSQRVSRNTKLQLHTTLIRPVLLYGSETWVLKTSDERLLDCFERRILRTICGGKQEGDLWRRRYNSELYELYNQPCVSKTIKINRIRWMGHVERMPEHNPTKMVCNIAPLGRRARGRPKKRYIEDVERDLKILGVRRWREVARNRREWKALLKEAKAHPGL